MMNNKSERRYIVFGNKPFAKKEEILGLDIFNDKGIVITDRGMYSCSLDVFEKFIKDIRYSITEACSLPENFIGSEGE